MTMKQMEPSTRGSNDRRIISFLVTAADDNDALDQASSGGSLPNGAPPIYDGLPIMDARVTPLSERPREWFPGDGSKRLFRVDAQYTLNSVAVISQSTNAKPVDTDKPLGTGAGESDDPDKELFSFDVAVQDQLELRPQDATNEVIDFNVGISDVSQGQYEYAELAGYNFDPTYGFRGRNILRPRGSFTLDIRPDNSQVTRTYENFVIDTVGKVNSTTFRGWTKGQVMLVAARGESRNAEDWQFSFTFEVRKNRREDLGNGVVFSSVEGWDEVDPWYVPRIGTFNGQKVTIQLCRQATVWRPYKRDDLNGLII